MTDEKKQTKQTDAKYSKPAPWELIAASIAGVVSGLIAAAASIRKGFSEEAKHLPGIADIHYDHGNGGLKEKGLLAKHQQALFEKDLEYRNKPDLWRKRASEIRELKREFYDARANLLEKEYGVASKGWTGIFKGTYQRLWSIGGGTRKEIAFKGTSIAVIIGVAGYNLLTSIATRAKARQIEDLIIDRVLEIPEVKEHHKAAVYEKEGAPTNRVHEAMPTERVKTSEHKAAISV